MFGAAHMSAAERQHTEDQQRTDMEARGVRPEVFAAMMEELGTARLETLPMEDRPRNAPVAVRHGHQSGRAQPAVPMSARRNQWTAAIASGRFNDADAEAVAGLTPLDRRRVVVVQELATRALDHNAVGALQQAQDYTHRAPATTRATRRPGSAHGRRGEIPPWVPVPRTSTPGIVLSDDHTPVRNFGGQNRINNTQLSMASRPTSAASQPKKMHSHWARGVPSDPRVVAANFETVSPSTQNIARSAAEVFPVAEAQGVTTQAVVDAPVTIQTQPVVQPPQASTNSESPEVGNIDFTSVVYYLDRSTQPAKIGKAQIRLAKPPGSALGSFHIRFAVSLSHLQPAFYQVSNIRLPEPTDLENHRVTLACKKESDGPEDLHLMQFDTGETLTKFMTTFNLLRENQSAQPTSGDPVPVNPISARPAVESVHVKPAPVEHVLKEQEGLAIDSDVTTNASTTQVTKSLDTLSVHSEIPVPHEATQAEVSTPARKTASVEVNTDPASTTAGALPSVLVSYNTPSPGRHRSPPDLVSLDSSPGSGSPTQSATQDLAGLQPWYTHEAAVSTVTGTAEVSRLANDLSTLTISTSTVHQDAKQHVPVHNDSDTQGVANASDATVAVQDKSEATISQAETQNSVDDKTAMRNALHRLEDTLMELFQLEDGGVPGDVIGIQQTIQGIKQAVATRVRPLLKQSRYFGGLTEDEKTQVLEEFLGEEPLAGDIANSEAISESSPSPSPPLTTAYDGRGGESMTNPRIEYTFDQIHELYRDDYPAPQKLFELEIAPMILNSHNRAAMTTASAQLSATAPMATGEKAFISATPPVSKPTEDAAWGDNDTADDMVVEEVPVNEAKQEDKPKNTVKPASGTARDLASRFRSFKINTPAPNTNSNRIAQDPVHVSTNPVHVSTDPVDVSTDPVDVSTDPVDVSTGVTTVEAQGTCFALDQINGDATGARAVNHTNHQKETSYDVLNEVTGSNEPSHGDTTFEAPVPAALNPAAAHFAPVVTASDASPSAPVVAPITLARPSADITRGLSSSRWANGSTVRISNEGCFTGVTVRTDRA
ncbi:hypothetical protein DL546_005499 [Coniochaeta pulveracea]|uniref:Uncharacterized protein n=1 Tax=Coniochaeta pulveracea TaxID=177199 RepID=A0A420YNC0_9PEZI|nr:hypothetical protein DL546_005499 [Coniochaeta pulveracea]